MLFFINPREKLQHYWLMKMVKYSRNKNMKSFLEMSVQVVGRVEVHKIKPKQDKMKIIKKNK